jgi:uncharacterized protein YraI
MRLPGFLAAAVLLVVPTAALAAPGIVTHSVNMRAGPGPGFPVVDRLPGGARVNVHGCVRGARWCDVSWRRDRGWVSAQALQYYYRNRYVYLPDYVDVIDIPIVSFAVSSYWPTYYSSRPFFRRQAYWNNYWRSQERFVTGPSGRHARDFDRGTRTAITQGSIRERGFTDRADRRFNERGTAGRQGFEGRQGLVGRQGIEARRGFEGRQGFARREGFEARRGFEGRQGFEARQGLAGRHDFQGPRQPMAGRAVTGPGMGGPAAQPNVGRHGGAPFAGRAPSQPLSAQGQMGGPRAMGGGMPHAGGAGGGAAHGGGPAISAGPRGGGPAGGAAAGGPPGGGRGRPH